MSNPINPNSKHSGRIDRHYYSFSNKWCLLNLSLKRHQFFALHYFDYFISKNKSVFFNLTLATLFLSSDSVLILMGNYALTQNLITCFISNEFSFTPPWKWSFLSIPLSLEARTVIISLWFWSSKFNFIGFQQSYYFPKTNFLHCLMQQSTRNFILLAIFRIIMCVS